MISSPVPNSLSLALPQDRPLFRIGGSLAGSAARWLFALREINRMYEHVLRRSNREKFIESVLDELGIELRVSAEDLSRIPGSGRLIVVANHPFGALDGLALAALLRRVRPDVKLLANRLLRAIPELHETFLFVNAFGGSTAAAENALAMRRALGWLREGGALAVFPAGAVSHLHLRDGCVRDGQWSDAIGRLVRLSGAPVVPVFFEGRNSGLFQLAGLAHPRLRTLLLPRELLKQSASTIRCHIGSAIVPPRLERCDSDGERSQYLRLRTDILRARASSPSRVVSSRRRGQPIAQPLSSEIVALEIDSLPPQQQLEAAGDLAVFFAHADQIPSTLQEIGRLREIAFRSAGEGTGRARDLDPFDKYYIHLLVWNRRQREIVGSYRMGLTDQILERLGRDGLYTSTLFRYNEHLLRQISPAIELGRSFVRPEYQRQFAPLLLLWKGIARFVARNPRYRRLFGPVSISNDYASLSKQILMTFLRMNRACPRLARWIRPRHAPRLRADGAWERALAGRTVDRLEEVDDLVMEIESHRRGMPVLLRQYLKLGATLLGFNVDPDFGDVLDGLMLVDLLAVEPAVLNRYMGRERAAAFRAYHACDLPATRLVTTSSTDKHPARPRRSACP